MSDLMIKVVCALMAGRPKPIQRYLSRHFFRDPRKNAIVQIEFPRYRHGCVSRALQRLLKEDGGRGKILGTLTDEDDLEMGDFLHPDTMEHRTIGPVEYCDVETKNGKQLSCPKNAFYLLRNGGKRLAVYLALYKWEPKISIEIMARDRKVALAFMQKVKTLVDQMSIYKESVIVMKKCGEGELMAEFSRVKNVTSEQVIMPQSVLADIRRMTVDFSKHREWLLAQKRHLKRGLLLYGPPGTGKSLTVMHLISEMPGRTTVLLTGRTVEWMTEACALARSLQPATVVIDDVDLVAAERGANHSNLVLMELLNQMDGIADDADILFLLTTNKPESLEPAVASRPGRIDQAIEVPLPDRECRRKLFDLYAAGLHLEVDYVEEFIDKTDGANAAFMRELLRKAALFAAEESGNGNGAWTGNENGNGNGNGNGHGNGNGNSNGKLSHPVVRDRHLDAALGQIAGGDGFTRKFLGYGKLENI